MTETARSGRHRDWIRLAVSVGFLVAGSLHFFALDAEMRLIPAFLPWRRGLVLLSGLAELVGALALLHPQSRRPAAYGLAALLVAVFPANINHAVNNIQLGDAPAPLLYHLIRLPLQPLLIWVTLWSGGIHWCGDKNTRRAHAGPNQAEQAAAACGLAHEYRGRKSASPRSL